MIWSSHLFLFRNRPKIALNNFLDTQACSTAVYFYSSFVSCPVGSPKYCKTRKNTQPYYTMSNKIYLSNCLDSEFCKHSWTKRKLMRCVAWHVVRDKWGGVFCRWTIIYAKVVMSCGCHSFSKPVKNPVFLTHFSWLKKFMYKNNTCTQLRSAVCVKHGYNVVRSFLALGKAAQ